MFKAELKIKDSTDTYSGEGETLLEAMEQIRPSKILKSIGVLTLSNGAKSVVKGLNAPKLNRLFLSENKDVKSIALQSFVKFIKSAL